MQHQQPVEGGGGPQTFGGGAAAVVAISDEDQKLGDLGIEEAASPISSRPPAPTLIGAANFEELNQATAEAGGSSSNRWPRQETLALLQIRSEMDAAFRDATLKGPLWEQISRKLSELGYKRSAKKCKEKFENVHKYYKRTKEGRGGRQDGKSYKFFSQLEALHHNPTAAVLPNSTSLNAALAITSLPPVMPQQDVAAISFSLPPPDHNDSAAALFGISFSSDCSSSSSDGEDDDDEEMAMEMGDNRKRKRSHGDGDGDGDGDRRMMDFFEGLLKQVMQKQESLQQRFLEAIEKREQDRMIREEAWKRQDMARIAREHELMAQERAVSASRDAAIIDFLQKITGHKIQLPTAVPRSEPLEQHISGRHPFDQPQNVAVPESIPAQQQMPMPLQNLGGRSAVEASSARWPKAEVLQLIKIRSSLEPRYQEVGPKGPLWEEISSGMKRIGYNRSAKRCKEKWENINKYFKKVKESNKKRPQDAKTCPYFDELDALYGKKVIGNTSADLMINAGASTSLFELERKQQEQYVGMQPPQSSVSNVSEGTAEVQTSGAGAFASNPLGEQSQTNIAGEKQPEDMLDKGHYQIHGDKTEIYCNSNHHSNSDDLDKDNYEEVDENEAYEHKTEEEFNTVYKIQFQRPNVGSSSGGGASATSAFVAMVQ